MMRRQRGFTLVELVSFVIITGILATTLMLSASTGLIQAPSIHYEQMAIELANQCMEGFLGERRLLGYSNSLLACSTSPTLPSVCTAPSGFTVSAVISCSPTLSGDTATSSTVTVTVSGLGQATTTMLIASY